MIRQCSSKSTNRRQRNNIDSGRAWLVMVTTWWSLVLTGGIISTVGIFHIYFLNAFDDDPTTIASVGALFSGLSCLSGPLASTIANKSSCRVCMFIDGVLSALGMAGSSYVTTLGSMFVSFGIVASVGLGLAYFPSVVILGYYFERRRNLATGIAVTGVPIGIMILPPIFQQMEARYGWRGTLLLSGGICLNLCVCAMMMKPSILEKQASQHGSSNNEHKSWTVPSCLSRLVSRTCEDIREVLLLSRKKSFVFMCLCNTLRCSAGNIVYLHLPNFALENGNNLSDVSRLFLAMGVGSVLGRLLTGIGTNNKQDGAGLDMYAISFGSFGVLSIVTGLLPMYSSSKLGLLSYAFLFGFYYGVFPAILNPLIVAVLGLRHLAMAYAVLILANGIGNIGGPPLASWFKIITESYESSFVLTGGIFLVSSLAFLGVPGRLDNSTPQEITDIDKTYQIEENGSDIMGDKLNNDNKTLQTAYKRETIDQVEVFVTSHCDVTDSICY